MESVFPSLALVKVLPTCLRFTFLAVLNCGAYGRPSLFRRLMEDPHG